MRNPSSLSGRLVPILTLLAVLTSACLSGCSMAPAKRQASSSLDLSEACLRRAQPPAELLRVEDEPVADGETVRAALGLLDPLRAALRRQNERMRLLIEWAGGEP